MAEDLRSRFPRVAVIHEWLTIPGGSEKAMMAILDLVPQAELFTSVYDPSPWPDIITSRPVHTSFLNRWPGAKQNYTRLLPFMDTAFRSFDLSGFDLVISSNHACAKNVRVPAGVPHVCYCYTPMRYAWDPSFLELEELGPVARLLVPMATAWLRRVDRRRGAGPDQFVAISRYIAGRIRNAYGRDSRVIYPPVDVKPLLDTRRGAGDAYLVFGRLVPYKRVDIAVAACERLGRRLIVAGEGRDMSRLRSMASSHTEFIGHVDDADVPELLAGTRALLFPGVEDFGIVPVEAQAAGVPVIANDIGGACETVVDGETGVLYAPGSVDGLCAAIERFESLEFDADVLRENARRFAPERFAAEFSEVLATVGRGRG